MQSTVLSERFERARRAAQGRWREIFIACGIDEAFYRAGRGRAPTAAAATGLFLTTSSAPATSSAAARPRRRV